MTAKVIDGKKIAEGIIKDIKSRVDGMKKRPGLAVILVGDNPASQLYVSMKERDSEKSGIYFEKYALDKNTGNLELLKLIDKLNRDEKITGIIVQLPLPEHINEHLIIDAILPHKDVDGFSPINMGNLLIGKNIIVPATPRGVIALIESTGIKIDGKNAVVVGRSNIVGKPIAALLLQKNATVTICHSKTKDLDWHAKNADILIAAIGKPRLIKKEMVKKGAVVIDVGTTKIGDKLFGDVDFEDVKKVASFISPVPGGVGPMTRAMLLQNTLDAMELYKR